MCAALLLWGLKRLTLPLMLPCSASESRLQGTKRRMFGPPLLDLIHRLFNHRDEGVMWVCFLIPPSLATSLVITFARNYSKDQCGQNLRHKRLPPPSVRGPGAKVPKEKRL
ncbi:hypothetical protein K458DRAFT_407727 [Lentithecium fluviatile CBS 122367]|uniref:Uncharacterized protein n=1 Tax=Lentithecium fluviatile CBS 122367 TaxID=1168545 RepID=A0A6G1IP53_9PLEO|nr:hypothetical protein K458DRAFT_407727 [Lentithecium fluviatile CBS 122367]